LGSVRLSGLAKQCICEWLYTVVHSGRPMPAAGDVTQCGEGVCIVLDPVLSEVWRDIIWNSLSLRIVTLTLLLSDKEVPGLGSRPFYIS